VESPTPSICIIIKGMVIVKVPIKKSILLLQDTEVGSIMISLPMREGTIELGIFPINGKNRFTFKLLAKDREVAWCINTADATVVARAVLMTMTRVPTIMTDKIIVRVGSYDGDAGCGGGRWGCRMFAITHGMVGRGRSGCACNTCLMCGSRGTSSLRSPKLVHRFICYG